MIAEIPILRHGKPYESVEKVDILHHATGEPVARVNQANSGLVARDIRRMDDRVLEQFPVAELLGLCRRAGELFVSATLPVGNAQQSFDDYIASLSATTGMPVTYCRNNAAKIQKVLTDMETIVRGLTRGFELSILDRGYGRHKDGTLSFFRAGRVFGAVLPSNSPGVHGLWIPAIALKAPIVLKAGSQEPWTPLRIIESLAAAGVPRGAFGFYPTDHAGAGEILRLTDRSMLFGDESTTRPWRNDPRVELHGPGYSKVILGDDTADDWERYLDIMVSSIAANGGRSCINASAIWTPRHGRAIAEAIAQRLAAVKALPADDPKAEIAAFANPMIAERISGAIDAALRNEGAVDLTEKIRGSSRHVPPLNPPLVKGGSGAAPLVTGGSEASERPRGLKPAARSEIGIGSKGGSGRLRRCGYLLPTVTWCEDREHPLANREFLFPYASVVECPTAEMPEAIGRTLVVSAITQDQGFIDALMASSNVDRLNIGAIPTYQISWDQPHEGNLFEHLYRQRAFQIESAA